MNIFIGLDDTDNLSSRGTGRLAREIANQLADQLEILGVVRQQFLVDPRIPYTSHNSSAVILATGPDSTALATIFDKVRALMLADFQPGSDPGLCVTSSVPEPLTVFGKRAQQEVVTQQEARDLASRYGILLEGLGGSEDGVIGALGGIGLCATGNDGRYLTVGNICELTGLQPIEAILSAGISAIQTLDGSPVSEGLVLADKLRPARRGGQPVAFVDWAEGHWQPLKVN